MSEVIAVEISFEQALETIKLEEALAIYKKNTKKPAFEKALKNALGEKDV